MRALAWSLAFALAPLCSAFVARAPVRMGGVEYCGIQHCGVLVADVNSALPFYTDVLGFEDESHLRPAKLPYPGAFVRVSEGQQIHLMQLPSVDPKSGRPAHGGRDRHMAIVVKDVEPLKQRLEDNGVDYTMSKSGRAAVFCRDADGNAFEFMEV